MSATAETTAGAAASPAATGRVSRVIGPVVDVDTSGPVDVPQLAARLAQVLRAG